MHQYSYGYKRHPPSNYTEAFGANPAPSHLSRYQVRQQLPHGHLLPEPAGRNLPVKGELTPPQGAMLKPNLFFFFFKFQSS